MDMLDPTSEEHQRKPLYNYTSSGYSWRCSLGELSQAHNVWKKGEFKIVQMDSHHGHHAQKVTGVSFEANCGQIMDCVNPVDDN